MPRFLYSFSMILRYFLLSLLLFCGLIISPQAGHSNQPETGQSAAHSHNTSSETDKIINAIQYGQNWLMNFQKPSGLFYYYYDPANNTFSTEDNLVRQIGSYQALIDSSHFVQDRNKLNETLHKFESALEKYKMEATVQGKKIIFFKDDRNEAAVNSSAGYLLALLSKHKHGLPLSATQKADIHKAAQGLIKMDSKKGGLYYLYFFPAEKNIITSFGTGFALHALEAYANYINDIRISNYVAALHKSYMDANPLDSVEFTDRSLIGYIPHALLSFSKRKNISENDYNEEIRPLIKKIIDHRSNDETCKEIGCVSLNPFYDAVIMEGTSTVYPLVKRYEKGSEFEIAVKSYIDKSASDVMDFQILSKNDYEEKTERTYDDDEKIIIGGFCGFPECPQIRNEMTMHAVSALDHYLASTALETSAFLRPEKISTSLQKASKWLIGTQKEDGLFHYEYNREDKKYSDDDNIVRQIGTFWSVIELYDYFRTPELKHVIEKFRGAIKDKIQTGEAGGEEIAFIKYNGMAKINSSALYVIALSRLKQIGLNVSEEEEKTLEKIITGALKMRSDQGFYYLYYIPKGKNRISVYGSSQMLMAFNLYQKAFGKVLGEEDLKNIETTSNHLFDQAMKTNIPDEGFRAYMLWGIYDAAINNNGEKTAAIIDRLITYRKNNDNCKDGPCMVENPDPALLEGVLFAYKTLPSEQQKQLEDYIQKSLKNLAALQVTSNDKRENGGYCKDEDCQTLRIDITQHHAVSLLNALRSNIHYY